MASSRRKTEIRLAPKHLDKMLFINYKEEEKLQHRLQTLTNSSRLRGYELDREKIQVHNEMRLNKRRNSAPSLVTVSPVAAVTQRCRSTQPPTREAGSRPGGSLGPSRRGSVTDPVNEYLLTEFRRVSEVIPSILSSLNKDDKRKEEEGEEGVGRQAKRRATVPRVNDVFSNLAAPRVRLDPDLARFASKEKDGQVNIGNIVKNIRTIRTLREEIAGRKRLEINKAKTSFKDLLKNIREEESKGSDSDTYTDGACALLRRKMHKARRASMPAIDAQAPGGGETASGGDPRARKQSLAAPAGGAAARPSIPISRSATSLASIGRQGSRDFETMMRNMLLEEERQMTEMKVASELQRYDNICARIGHFLHEVENRRRVSLPVLSGLQAQEEHAN